MKDELHLNKAILGICIPTYNRAEILKERLSEIEPYVEKYGMHIYISDNASTDNTSEVVALYKDNPNIHYNRNEKNVGFDRNVEIVLKMCTQPYAWLTGDDSCINLDFEEIECELVSKSPEVLFLDYNHLARKDYYSDAYEIFLELMYGFSSMESLIISSEIIAKLDFRRYYDSVFVHAASLMDYVLLNGANVCVMSPQRYFAMKHTAYKGVSEYSVFGVRCKYWIETLSHLPSITYEDIQLQILTSTPYLFNNARLFQQRALGTYSVKTLKKYGHWIKFYRNGPSWLLWAIAAFPMPIARCIYKCYRSIKKMDDIPCNLDDDEKGFVPQSD